jgi:hypothetical protein
VQSTAGPVSVLLRCYRHFDDHLDLLAQTVDDCGTNARETIQQGKESSGDGLRTAFALAQKPGNGQERCVGDHAMVGPHSLTFDVPAAVQYLKRASVDPLALQGLADLGSLGNRRRICNEDAPGAQR